MALVSFSLTSEFHRHIYHANFDQLMVTESYLQHDTSILWSKLLQEKFPPTPLASIFPPFDAIWKTLLELVLVFLFTPSLFSFETLYFFSDPTPVAITKLTSLSNIINSKLLRINQVNCLT